MRKKSTKGCQIPSPVWSILEQEKDGEKTIPGRARFEETDRKSVGGREGLASEEMGRGELGKNGRGKRGALARDGENLQGFRREKHLLRT
jgi:hypothetical protein